ncbi:MAG TPA: SMI1/KNR4 family protein, partial [Planctomycetota bacterium]|nr:SMI1/KNR4 family protein [Planctomycetota bacterium]
MRSVKDVLDRMRARGWRPAAPAHPGHVAQVEKEFDLTLPEDYRLYLLEAGGGPTLSPEAFTGLWPAASLLVWNRHYRIPWNFPGLLGIGNDGFLVYAYDFRQPQAPIVSLGLSSSVWDDVVV